MKSKWIMFAALGLTIAGSASAAVMTSGYTIGSSLLTSGGKTLFLDSAALGGGDGKRATPNDWDTFLVPGTGFWEVGQTVNITGVALPIINVGTGTAPNTTDLGTTTFTVRKAVGGSGTSGAGGLAVLGTATGVLGSASGTGVYYVNFDTPITFVVDANSTSIGIHVAHSGAIWLKEANLLPVTKYNYVTGALGSNEGTFSVAGTVVPEPASFMLAGFGALALGFSRRRC